MAVMIIDAINVSLRLFVLLIVVEFALDFFCMSLVCVIFRVWFVLFFVRLTLSGSAASSVVHFWLSVMMTGQRAWR